MIRAQTTIRSSISCYGIGLHSGKKCQITIHPAPKDIGVIFRRTDITTVNNIVKACYKNVKDTKLSTTISNKEKISISTIEHLMAAINGCAVDNAIIDIDGPEIPIMDGSSKAFVFMIECVGRRYIANSIKKTIEVKKEVEVNIGDSYIIAEPSKDLKITLKIKFDSEAIGSQTSCLNNIKDFSSKIASSRTFGFKSDLCKLQNMGLAKGASLDNAIGIEGNKILNHEGLRYKNEFARHKLLDLIGDMATAKHTIAANIKANKPSHLLNNLFLQELLKNPNNYKYQ